MRRKEIHMARCHGDSPIQVQDVCTISSTVVSVSGPIGSQSILVLQPTSQFPAPTFTALASDSLGSSGQGQATSLDGQTYGTISESVSTPAVVQSIAGTGSIAVLTVQLNSGLVVQVPANACATPNQGGIALGSI